MRAVLTAVLLGHGLWTGLPLVRVLLPGIALADAVVLGPGLALGLYTWLLAWIALLPGQPLSGWGALAAWALLAIPAHLADRRRPWELARRLAAPETRAAVSLELKGASGAAWLIVAVFFAGAALLAVFFPATHWDFLGRYGLQAQALFREGGLSASVSGYPPMVALFYAAVYAGLGGIDECAAKVQGPLFGALLLALTFRLAARPRHPWVGRGAVLLVGLSPMFLNSVPAGDPDLALTYFLTAALYLLVRPPPDAPWRVSLACGLALGLALWAKQAGGPMVGSVLLVMALSGAGLLRAGWATFRPLAGVLVVAALLVAPWYLRNVALTGRLLELANPGDTLLADRSLPSLLAPIRWWDELGCPGSPFLFLGMVALVGGALAPGDGAARISPVTAGLVLAGLLAAGELVRAGLGRTVPPIDDYARFAALLVAGTLVAARPGPLGLSPGPTVLLCWIGPLLVVWWVKFSFAARYLLPILPVLAASGAAAGARALGPHLRRSPAAWAILLPLTALLTSETYPLWRLTLAHVFESPGRSREEKWLVYPGPLVRIARRLDAEAPQAKRVGTNDSRLAYFLPPGVTTAPLPSTGPELVKLDYVVIAPFGNAMASTPEEIRRRLEPTRRLLAGAPLLADSGYELWRVPR